MATSARKTEASGVMDFTNEYQWSHMVTVWELHCGSLEFVQAALKTWVILLFWGSTKLMKGRMLLNAPIRIAERVRCQLFENVTERLVSITAPNSPTAPRRRTVKWRAGEALSVLTPRLIPQGARYQQEADNRALWSVWFQKRIVPLFGDVQ